MIEWRTDNELLAVYVGAWSLHLGVARLWWVWGYEFEYAHYWGLGPLVLVTRQRRLPPPPRVPRELK